MADNKKEEKKDVVVGNDDIQQGANSEQSLMGQPEGGQLPVEQSDARSDKELMKAAKDLGLVVKQGTSKEALLKMVQDGEADPERHVYKEGVGEERVGGTQPSDEIQFTEEETVLARNGVEFVKVESADDKVLRAQINGRVYEGKSFNVQKENVAGVKETLLARGYLLK